MLQISTSKGPKVDADGDDDPLSDILDQYGCGTETPEQIEQLAAQEIEDSSL